MKADKSEGFWDIARLSNQLTLYSLPHIRVPFPFLYFREGIFSLHRIYQWWIFFFQVYIKVFLQMSQLIINDEHNGKRAKKWSVSTYRTEINLSGVELKT